MRLLFFALAWVNPDQKVSCLTGSVFATEFQCIIILMQRAWNWSATPKFCPDIESGKQSYVQPLEYRHLISSVSVLKPVLSVQISESMQHVSTRIKARAPTRSRTLLKLQCILLPEHGPVRGLYWNRNGYYFLVL